MIVTALHCSRPRLPSSVVTAWWDLSNSSRSVSWLRLGASENNGLLGKLVSFHIFSCSLWPITGIFGWRPSMKPESLLSTISPRPMTACEYVISWSTSPTPPQPHLLVLICGGLLYGPGHQRDSRKCLVLSWRTHRPGLSFSLPLLHGLSLNLSVPQCLFPI